MKRRLIVALGLFTALCSHAQDSYPNRPIRLVVVTAPGGPSDTVGRLIMQKLGEVMKAVTVVDNKPGAGGMIASKEVERAPADGYTLLLATSSTHGINPWFYPNIGYDPVKDFSLVSILATTDYGLAVQADSPARSVADLVKMSKGANKVNVAYSGNGTTTHLAAALLTTESKADFVPVPYKAAPLALNGLLGGEVGFMFESTSLFTPFVQGGKLRLLATTGAVRSTLSPATPTLKESGYPDYEIIGWFALMAPANLPKPVLERLNREVVAILAMPDIQKRLAELGLVPAPTTPSAGSAFVAAQLAKFGGIVQRANIKP